MGAWNLQYPIIDINRGNSESIRNAIAGIGEAFAERGRRRQDKIDEDNRIAKAEELAQKERDRIKLEQEPDRNALLEMLQPKRDDAPIQSGISDATAGRRVGRVNLDLGSGGQGSFQPSRSITTPQSDVPQGVSLAYLQRLAGQKREDERAAAERAAEIEKAAAARAVTLDDRYEGRTYAEGIAAKNREQEVGDTKEKREHDVSVEATKHGNRQALITQRNEAAQKTYKLRLREAGDDKIHAAAVQQGHLNYRKWVDSKAALMQDVTPEEAAGMMNYFIDAALATSKRVSPQGGADQRAAEINALFDDLLKGGPPSPK